MPNESANFIQQAKQGNPKAIAALINQSLQGKGIKVVKSSLNEGTLQLMLQGEKIPDKAKITAFIRQGLIKLKIPSLETVYLYAKSSQENKVIWKEKIVLQETQASFNLVSANFSQPPKSSHPRTSELSSTGYNQKTSRSKAQKQEQKPTLPFDLQTLMDPRLWTINMWRWVLGVMILLSAFVLITVLAIWSALCYIIVGCLLVPPICDWIVEKIEDRFQVRLSSFVLIVVGVVFFMASALGMPDVEEIGTTPESSPPPIESTETAPESSPIETENSPMPPSSEPVSIPMEQLKGYFTEAEEILQLGRNMEGIRGDDLPSVKKCGEAMRINQDQKQKALQDKVDAAIPSGAVNFKYVELTSAIAKLSVCTTCSKDALDYCDSAEKSLKKARQQLEIPQ